MASSSSSSSSYQDLADSASLPNDFNFSYFDVSKDALFDQSNTFHLGQDPFPATNWGETLQPNEILYLNSDNWKSPELKVEHQFLTDFSIPNSATAAKHEITQSNTISLNMQNTSNCSPQSASSSKSCSTSSPGNSRTGRKRKSIAELDDDEDDDSNPLMKKSAHNMIEKRYRTNLNDKIAALRDSVPSLRIMSKSARGEDTVDDREDLQGLTPAHKLNKATVLSKATEYICHLEKRNKRLQQENSDQKAQLAAYESFFQSNSVDFNSSHHIGNAFQLPSDYSSPSKPSATRNQIMEQESSDSRRLRSQNYDQAYQNPPQEIYSQSQQQSLRSEGWNGHPYMGKLMIGTMAGLMIMEGYNENEQNSDSSAGRGLFALPTSILKFFKFLVDLPPDIHLFGYHTSAQQILWYLKFILIFGSILYIILPELSSNSSYTRSNRGKTQDNLLASAPSPTSPIQTRRQAWLMAIQTVWVPRYVIFLETVALCLKIARLSIRNVFGWQAYTYLTGTNEQQETARIEAWSIALYAQLTAGNIDVNKSRLTQNLLLASATLPDTPIRLMLKALQIRVLFWKLKKLGLYNHYLLGGLASRLIGWKWKKAQLLLELDAHQSKKLSSLPYHLITLLQQSNDDLLNDSIDQIAYNLAWNLPITLNDSEETDCINAAVNDPMIRSPLDAIASWYSSLVLQKALSNSLKVKEDDSIGKKMVTNDVNLAVKTAPTGSIQHTRALVARSVLVNEKRGANIAEVMQALGPQNKHRIRSTPKNLIYDSAPTVSLSEVEISLRCAMAIAHIERCPAPEYPEKAAQVIKNISLRNISLLGFIATFKLMERMDAHERMASICADSLEKLSGGLRLWIGGKNGEKIGLPLEVKKEKVERCLATTRRIIGM